MTSSCLGLKHWNFLTQSLVIRKRKYFKDDLEVKEQEGDEEGKKEKTKIGTTDQEKKA